MFSFDEVLAADPQVAEAIQLEVGRQNSNIELIASENFVSKAVMVGIDRAIRDMIDAIKV